MAVASGQSMKPLIHKLLDMSKEQFQLYSGIYAPDIMLIAGPNLPWVDGIQYLGKHSEAPNLLLPTNLQCNVPLSILDKAVCQLEVEPPIAILPKNNTVLSFRPALPLCSDKLLNLLRAS